MADDERFILPTDTAHVSIEGRQYQILGIDLAEGISRVKLVLGAAVLVPWIALMALLGVPLLGRGMFLYIAPPVMLLIVAFRTDDGGRPRYQAWLDRWRFAWRRRRPIVELPGGTATTTPYIARAEWVVLDAEAIAARVNRTQRKARS